MQKVGVFIKSQRPQLIVRKGLVEDFSSKSDVLTFVPQSLLSCDDFSGIKVIM